LNNYGRNWYKFATDIFPKLQAHISATTCLASVTSLARFLTALGRSLGFLTLLSATVPLCFWLRARSQGIAWSSSLTSPHSTMTPSSALLYVASSDYHHPASSPGFPLTQLVLLATSWFKLRGVHTSWRVLMCRITPAGNCICLPFARCGGDASVHIGHSWLVMALAKVIGDVRGALGVGVEVFTDPTMLVQLLNNGNDGLRPCGYGCLALSLTASEDRNLLLVPQFPVCSAFLAPRRLLNVAALICRDKKAKFDTYSEVRGCGVAPTCIRFIPFPVMRGNLCSQWPCRGFFDTVGP
jgi:hypothetical protein